jgi:hypothetical protein
MKFNINWQTIKQHTIDVSAMSAPIEIQHYFAKHKIEKYVYRIKYKDIVIKFGMSAPKARSAEPGDRLYRQIAHIKSWGNQRIRGSSGADWVYIEEDFKNSYTHSIDHKFVTIQIYDFTNYTFESIKPDYEVYYAEQLLINQYATLVGNKPIGNVNDETTMARFQHKSFIKVDLWDSIFMPVDNLFEV